MRNSIYARLPSGFGRSKYGAMPNSSVYHCLAAARSAAQKLMVASPRNMGVPFVIYENRAFASRSFYVCVYRFSPPGLSPQAPEEASNIADEQIGRLHRR